MIGLYYPGRSFVHRAPTLLKLSVLAVSVIGVSLIPDPWFLAATLGGVVVLILLAGVPLRVVWTQVAPILWLLVIAVPLQMIFAGWLVAALMAGRLLIAVALAALFTLTTTVTSVLETFQVLLRPFRRWVDTDRVGLLVALTIRCIPLIADIVTEVLEARKARGAQGSIVALAVPVVVRSLYAADAIGEALTARGFDD